MTTFTTTSNTAELASLERGERNRTVTSDSFRLYPRAVTRLGPTNAATNAAFAALDALLTARIALEAAIRAGDATSVDTAFVAYEAADAAYKATQAR